MRLLMDESMNDTKIENRTGDAAPNKQESTINLTNHTLSHSYDLQEVLLVGQLSGDLHLLNLFQ